MNSCRPASWRTTTTLAVLTAALAAGCRSSTDLPAYPNRITVVAGADQVVPVGTAAPVAPAVQVRDLSGNSLPGIVVRFAVTAGGGSVIGDSTKTDGRGIATVGQWLMGTKLGQNTIQATASDIPTVAVIHATAVAGSPASVTPVGAETYAALVAQQVSPPPMVEVHDAYGNPVAGTGVTFTVTVNNGTITGGSTTTDSLGRAQLGSWTLGTAAGVNRLIAATNNGVFYVFEAEGLDGQPQIASASPVSQAGYLHFQVTTIPRVLVTNTAGAPVPNVPVTFAIADGGDAVLTGGDAVTDADGIATPIDWRLGAATASTVTATVLGFPTAQVTFHATGIATPFVIDLRFLTSLTPDERDGFVAAARRWMGIITADIPDVPVSLAAGACANGESPALNETVDDVIIFATVEYIDGPNGILGSSGPCVRRTGSKLTVVGQMQFDESDLATLDLHNQLIPVVTHEMAHVLGYGTTWTDLGLLQGAGGNDPYFTGAQALVQWPLTMLAYGGTPIPVENQGPVGTRDVHWRESVFKTELMTGYVESPGVFMPLSRISIASMGDLGYHVDLSKADPFGANLLANAPSTFGVAVRLNEDVQHARWDVAPNGQLMPITP
jgi:Leishmanolysin